MRRYGKNILKYTVLGGATIILVNVLRRMRQEGEESYASMGISSEGAELRTPYSPDDMAASYEDLHALTED